MTDSADFIAGKHLGYIEGMMVAGSRDISAALMEPEIMPRIIEAAQRFGLAVHVGDKSFSIYAPAPEKPRLTLVSDK